MALMVSTTLVLYCFLAAGIYLLLISILIEFLGKHLGLLKGLSPELIEKSSPGVFVMNFLIEFLFFVVIPTLGYSFFYLILPYGGVKSGVATALFAFVLGAVPLSMSISVRIKLPMPYLLYALLAYLLKIAGALALIGYVYTL
ncbi:MAG TPA: hypothetical protein VJ983_01180 [candidate division Zixibacteria bacterium]|nr:hypothetical protein [candidate division Zixibacteria bacterium]